MKTAIRLTIQSIIRTEQMLDKPFSEIDYESQNELTTLLYCMVQTSNPERLTIKEFLILMESKKYAESVMKAFNQESSIIEQFSVKKQVVVAKNGDEVDAEEAPIVYIKDLAYMLITSGISADYVLNQMEISDLYMALDAHSKAKKEKMESDRLWAFMTMRPHIDGNKFKSPQDIYPFPWEIDEMQTAAKKDLEDNTGLFESFMRGEIKFDLNK